MVHTHIPPSSKQRVSVPYHSVFQSFEWKTCMCFWKAANQTLHAFFWAGPPHTSFSYNWQSSDCVFISCISLCRSVCSYVLTDEYVFHLFFSSYLFSTFCYLAGFVLVAEQCSFREKISTQLNHILRCLIHTLVLNHCVSEMQIYLLFLWHKSLFVSSICFLWLLSWVKLG